MNMMKTKLGILAMCSAFMLPSVAGAATTTDSTKTTDSKATPTVKAVTTGQTNVNGVFVPGYYTVNPDSRVAYIPGGVGLVVVDKSTALPPGAYYVTK